MSVQTMQLCSLGQGTVSPWTILPRCPRVLLVLPTMSNSWDCETWDTWELPDIVGSTSNTLGQRGTMFHGDTVPCPMEKSCIVWTMEVEYSGGGVLIFSYLILIHQRDTFGDLYDNQVEPRQLDTSEFIGCRFVGPPITARLYLTNSAKRK